MAYGLGVAQGLEIAYGLTFVQLGEETSKLGVPEQADGAPQEEFAVAAPQLASGEPQFEAEELEESTPLDLQPPKRPKTPAFTELELIVAKASIAAMKQSRRMLAVSTQEVKMG